MALDKATRQTHHMALDVTLLSNGPMPEEMTSVLWIRTESLYPPTPPHTHTPTLSFHLHSYLSSYPLSMPPFWTRAPSPKAAVLMIGQVHRFHVPQPHPSRANNHALKTSQPLIILPTASSAPGLDERPRVGCAAAGYDCFAESHGPPFQFPQIFKQK